MIEIWHKLDEKQTTDAIVIFNGGAKELLPVGTYTFGGT